MEHSFILLTNQIAFRHGGYNHRQVTVLAFKDFPVYWEKHTKKKKKMENFNIEQNMLQYIKDAIMST